jgi:hypothetical protein
MERINKLYMIIGLVITFGLFFAIAAQADEEDEATTVTFSGPVEIPGQVLSPGTYLFKLADEGNDPNVVMIFNSEGTKLYATLETIPTERAKVTGDTAITLVAQGSGNPEALLKWFYPGRETGIEFMYPGHEEKQLALDTQHTILAGANTTDSETLKGE